MRGLQLLVCGVVYFALSSAQIRDLPEAVKNDIQAQQADVQRIIDLVEGNYKHKAWSMLANFTDTFGPRISGSQALEDSIDYILQFFEDNGFDNVHGENVTVPDWVRGEEHGQILTPRPQNMAVWALGGSVSTNSAIEAEAIVVRSFDELEARSSEVPGKIVVFNQEWTGYGSTVAYRHGSVQASKYGAIASLTKSIADFSIYSPHTGQVKYNESFSDKIPAACITIEDAELLQRYQDAGHTVRLNITFTPVTNPDTISRNVVAEMTGFEYPDEIVLFGGHIDSWDVGVGAMDDGGGCMISVMVLLIMKELGLQPKRTMRCVLWTAEEEGLIGADQYYEDHKADKDNFVWMIESDAGIFDPLYGIRFDGSGLATAYMEEIMELLEPMGATGVQAGASHPDLNVWDDEIPKGSLDIDRSTYFWYHHTHADTMEVMDPDVMDRATMVWAASTFAVANLDHRLPRDGEYPTTSGATQATATAVILVSVLYWFLYQ